MRLDARLVVFSGGCTKLNTIRPNKTSVIAVLAVLLMIPSVLAAQNKSQEPTNKADAHAGMVRLTILVTGGKEKKPVSNASVYVKFVHKRTLAKDKKIEMDLKTDIRGRCRTPEIPTGMFLIQVVAPGWNTFGEYYKVDQSKKTIPINLRPPPKWY